MELKVILKSYRTTASNHWISTQAQESNRRLCTSWLRSFYALLYRIHQNWHWLLHAAFSLHWQHLLYNSCFSCLVHSIHIAKSIMCFVSSRTILGYFSLEQTLYSHSTSLSFFFVRNSVSLFSNSLLTRISSKYFVFSSSKITQAWGIPGNSRGVYIMWCRIAQRTWLIHKRVSQTK